MAKDIKVRFKGEDKGAISTTKKVKGELGGLDKTVKKSNASMLAAGAAIGVAVVALRTMNRVMNDLQEAYYKQEAAVTKLEAALHATNNALGMSSTELQNFASQMASVTAIADEDIIATEALMVTFTKIGRDVFPTAIKAAADMSVMFGQDLQQSAIQLGTALNNPIAGVGRLLRIGISFTEEQKSMIASFIELNDLAGAQGVILDELAAEFGGVAEAMGEMAEAIDTRLKYAITDFKESLGGLLIEILGISEGKEKLTGFIDSIRKNFIDMPVLTRETQAGLEQLAKATNNWADISVKDYNTINELMERCQKIMSWQIEQNSQAALSWRNMRDQLSLMLGDLQEEYDAQQKRLALQIDINKGFEFYEIALEKTLTADEKKRREYELIIKGLQDYINILPRITSEEEAHFQTVAALRDLYREWLKAIGEVKEELTGWDVGEWGKDFGLPTGILMQGEVKEPGYTVTPGRGVGGVAGQLPQWAITLGGVMESFIGGLGNIISTFASFKAILDPVGLIFQGMMQVLQPLVDQILQPLIGIFIIIGRVLGSILAPVFEALAMIVDKLAQAFVWFYNKVIRPVGNFIISIFNIVANAMIAFANLFRRKSREIAYRPLTQGHLGEISLGDVYAAGETGMGGTTAGLGSTTTIQRQPDIYVYVNFNDAVIGPMGWEQAGADIADALERHVGIGGLVHIEEGLAPVGG